MKSYQNAGLAAKIIVEAVHAFPGLKDEMRPVNGADLVDFLTERIAPLSIDHTATEVVELLADTVGEEFIKGQ